MPPSHSTKWPRTGIRGLEAYPPVAVGTRLLWSSRSALGGSAAGVSVQRTASMRNVFAVVLVLGFATPALAQTSSGPVCRDVYLGPVIVKTSDHQTLRGTLQCLTDS